MWVYRGVIYVKPGYIAEAIAHVKSAPPVEGVAVRVLRPVNGSEAATKLVFDFSFEDVDAYFASRGRPGPANAWMQRWIELNQSRGEYELYQVVHEVPSKGAPGAWVQRRVRWMKPGARNEWVSLVRDASPLPWTGYSGYSFRVLYPRTGKEIGDILIDEVTFSSLAEHDAFIRDAVQASETPPWVKRLGELERRQSDVELYRVVE